MRLDEEVLPPTDSSPKQGHHFGREEGEDGRRRTVRPWDGAPVLAHAHYPPPRDRVVKAAQEAAKYSVKVQKVQNDVASLEERMGDCETCGRVLA